MMTMMVMIHVYSYSSKTQRNQSWVRQIHQQMIVISQSGKQQYGQHRKPAGRYAVLYLNAHTVNWRTQWAVLFCNHPKVDRPNHGRFSVSCCSFCLFQCHSSPLLDVICHFLWFPSFPSAFTCALDY